MADNLTNETIARNDVALYDLTKTFEVVVIADDQSATNGCTWLLFSLNDVDVDVVVLPELPGQGNAILTSCRRSEEEIASFEQI